MVEGCLFQRLRPVVEVLLLWVLPCARCRRISGKVSAVVGIVIAVGIIVVVIDVVAADTAATLTANTPTASTAESMAVARALPVLGRRDGEFRSTSGRRRGEC